MSVWVCDARWRPNLNHLLTDLREGLPIENIFIFDCCAFHCNQGIKPYFLMLAWVSSYDLEVDCMPPYFLWQTLRRTSYNFLLSLVKSSPAHRISLRTSFLGWMKTSQGTGCAADCEHSSFAHRSASTTFRCFSKEKSASFSFEWHRLDGFSHTSHSNLSPKASTSFVALL